MISNDIKIPKVFISYCWANEEIQKWVEELALRLRDHRVDAILDKWELKEGHDKYAYMESMVSNPEIDKVLVIIDKEYKIRADKYAGGVGTEIQIINPQVYSDVKQEKFIPVIAERDSDNQPYLPINFTSRMYIDLSDESRYETEYEKLLRNIFNRPANKKPELGTFPEFIFNDSKRNIESTLLIKKLFSAIDNNSPKVKSFTIDYLNHFISILKANYYQNNDKSNIEYYEHIYSTIISYTELRDELILVLEKVIHSNKEYDISSIIIEFLEKLYMLTLPDENVKQWRDSDYEPYRIIKYEIYLYIIAIGLKNKEYLFVSNLIYSTYYIFNKYINKSEAKSFDIFYYNSDILNIYYQEKYNSNKFSGLADIIMKRIHPNYTKYNINEADLLCFYIAQIKEYYWIPYTSVYVPEYKIDAIVKLESRKYFEEMKCLLNIETKNDVYKIIDHLDSIEIRSFNSVDYLLRRYLVSLKDLLKSIDIYSKN